MEPNLTQIPDMNETVKTSALIRKWLVLLADAYQFDVPELKPNSPSFADIWVLALEDLKFEQLDVGFRKLLQTWKPDYGRKFPAPGDLRALIDKSEIETDKAAAGMAWQFVMDSIREYFQGDIGWMHGGKCPVQDPRSLEAVRAVGGFAALNEASDRDLVWRKKEFINRYEQLRDWVPPPKQITAPVSLQDLIRPAQAAEPRELPAAPPQPRAVMTSLTAEEWENRKKEQKEKLAAWCKEKGIPHPFEVDSHT